jgi:ABC-type lipoprotein release transport system permease subunit
MLINLMNDYQTACYKYISQHIDDAVAWWNKENSQEEGVYYDTNIENIVNNYFSYVSAAMNKANNGSDMTEDEQAIVAAVKTIKDEIARDVMKIAYDNGAFDGYKLTGYVTSTGGTPIEKDVTVVGYVYNTTDIGDSKATLVMSDADVNSFTGGQEAGIYGYCVGAMDNSDRSLVGKCVTISNNEEGGVKFSLTNSVTLQLDMLNSMLEILGSVFLYVGLGFALFAALMLSNFIATSISYKRQEIGILRAIGSRGWDVFKIFFAESFIISMINFVLSLAATIAVTIILNGVFRTQVGMLITILSFGIRQVALLLGVSLLVALIATFLPVKKIASQKPIDAIRKR